MLCILTHCSLYPNLLHISSGSVILFYGGKRCYKLNFAWKRYRFSKANVYLQVSIYIIILIICPFVALSVSKWDILSTPHPWPSGRILFWTPLCNQVEYSFASHPHFVTEWDILPTSLSPTHTTKWDIFFLIKFKNLFQVFEHWLAICRYYRNEPCLWVSATSWCSKVNNWINYNTCFYFLLLEASIYHIHVWLGGGL